MNKKNSNLHSLFPIQKIQSETKCVWMKIWVGFNLRFEGLRVSRILNLSFRFLVFGFKPFKV
jgi:hypothetical protein